VDGEIVVISSLSDDVGLNVGTVVSHSDEIIRSPSDDIGRPVSTITSLSEDRTSPSDEIGTTA
jgi:hypothetical protein